MTQALVQLRDGTYAKVNVYRNGDTVTLIGKGTQQTPHGPIEIDIATRMNVATYEWGRRLVIARVGTLAYTRMLGRMGVDDNVMRAPALPGYTPPSLPPRLPPRLLRR